MHKRHNSLNYNNNRDKYNKKRPLDLYVSTIITDDDGDKDRHGL